MCENTLVFILKSQKTLENIQICFSSPQVNPWFHPKSFHSRKYEYLLIIFISKYQFVITIKRTLSEKLPE